MGVSFLDSSAVLKRYVNELGSAWLLSLVAPTAVNKIYVARITSVEVISALTRRGRGGSLLPVALTTAILDFRQDLATQYETIEITETLVNQAVRLAEKHALRGYDAVQLAAALEVNFSSVAVGVSLTLISADVELNRAAIAEGLTVEDPNDH